MNKRNYIGLMVLTFLIVVAGTLSYYTSNINGTLKGTSLKFAFNVYKIINSNETTFSDINLYDTAKVHNGIGEVIVPGDYGDFVIKVSSKGSEVKLRYDINLKGNDIPVNMKFYLDSDKTDKVEINPLTINGILGLEEDKEYTIYWEWPYDSGDDNIYDIDYQGKTFSIGLDINGKQAKNTEYAINYIGFDNSVVYPSVIDKDEELSIDLSKYNYTSLSLKQGNNDLSLDTHYTYENGILKLHNIIDNVTITNLTSFCNMYNVDNLKDCLIATDYPNFRKDRSLENARNNIESKKADFTKVEPYLTYTENILYNQTKTLNYTDATKKYYYSTNAPTFNVSTGKHELKTNLLGTIEEIRNNNGYTGFSTDQFLTTYENIYRIYECEATSSNTINITNYDKYTFSLNEDYSSKAGLYSIEDENNTKSYYFRGEVNNNWVSFGGFYWRILRINGDGSIRLIYSGTKDNHKGSGTTIGGSQFNTKQHGATYVGYMYNDDLELKKYPTNENSYNLIVNLNGKYYFGKDVSCDLNTKTCTISCEDDNCFQSKWSDLASDSSNYDSNRKYINPYKYSCFSQGNIQNNVITCDIVSEIMKVPEKNYENTAYVKHYGAFSKSYDDAIKNVKDSNIKQVVDEWYKNSFIGVKDDNDNLLTSYINETSSFCNDRSIKWGDGYTFNNSTSYKINARYQQPTLICSNDNDKFTTSASSYGNKKLIYPVALITADEVILAGAKLNIKNSKYYLYYGSNGVWTMTPYSFDTAYNATFVGAIAWNGSVAASNIKNSLGIRPVINLKTSIKVISGSGTENDPYLINN